MNALSDIPTDAIFTELKSRREIMRCELLALETVISEAGLACEDTVARLCQAASRTMPWRMTEKV
jgi:hypothetical protein